MKGYKIWFIEIGLLIVFGLLLFGLSTAYGSYGMSAGIFSNKTVFNDGTTDCNLDKEQDEFTWYFEPNSIYLIDFRLAFNSSASADIAFTYCAEDGLGGALADPPSILQQNGFTSLTQPPVLTGVTNKTFGLATAIQTNGTNQMYNQQVTVATDTEGGYFMFVWTQSVAEMSTSTLLRGSSMRVTKMNTNTDIMTTSTDLIVGNYFNLLYILTSAAFFLMVAWFIYKVIR